ncbi:MAG TPA: DegQ family serine endoprotease [Terracidiphilus sp.]|nr:DegQ family serine endoprotease [Terracidiphilus sp.]
MIGLVLIFAGMYQAGWLHLPGHNASIPKKIPLRVDKNTRPVSLGNFNNGFASVIDPVLPAVVNISSTKVVHRQNMPNFFANPLFQQFFGGQFSAPAQPQTEREQSLGSGVIVNSDGYILTNNHVVDGASDVEVFTQSRRKYRARIIGTDPRTDIAVLKIDATGLPTVSIGDSSALKVGDLVFAIGDPFGIGETATMGIVSATGRTLRGSVEHYEDFIQTDASINPGNSGGALIDLRGDLIGINTAIISANGGGNQGIGFAIPINMARRIMDQIIAHGKVVRGYLGVSIQDVNPDLAQAFGLKQGGGALVGDVSLGGPAAHAGLKRGDIILQLNGKNVASANDLSLRIAELAPGSVAHFEIYRNGNTQQIDVTLGAYPESGAASAFSGGGSSTALRGVQVQSLTSALAQHLGLPPDTLGVAVTGVDPASPAAAAGVQAGDVIQQVDRKPVKNLAQYQSTLQSAGGRPVLLLINRRGATMFVVVQP